MTTTLRNSIVVLSTILLLALLVVYLWAPRFLQKNPGEVIDPSSAQNLFATSSRSITGTITEVTDKGIRIEVPTSALEYGANESMRSRAVLIDGTTTIFRQELRADVAAYEDEMNRYQRLQSLRALTREEYTAIVSTSTVAATTTILERRGEINPNLPVVYKTATTSFEAFVASTSAAIVGSSTWLLERVPSPTVEIVLDRSVLAVGMTVAVIGYEPVTSSLDIQAEKIVVLSE